MGSSGPAALAELCVEEPRAEQRAESPPSSEDSDSADSAAESAESEPRNHHKWWHFPEEETAAEEQTSAALRQAWFQQMSAVHFTNEGMAVQRPLPLCREAVGRRFLREPLARGDSPEELMEVKAKFCPVCLERTSEEVSLVAD